MSVRSSTSALVLRAGTTTTSIDGWHRPQDAVRWGSVTKILTAGLVHRAVESGAWTWDTTSADVLGPTASAQITARALVTHTSGLPRMLPAQRRAVLDPYKPWTADRFDAEALPDLDHLIDADRRHNGEYSNLGYAILTRMLEQTWEVPWLDSVRERLLAPAGIEPATFDISCATGERDDVVEARSLLGRPLAEWRIGDGPFVGAGGATAPLPAMAMLLARAGTDGPLDPRLDPHAWEVIDGLAQHRGALMRSGAVAVLRVDDGTVGVASAVGGTPAFGDAAALRSLEALIEEEAS